MFYESVGSEQAQETTRGVNVGVPCRGLMQADFGTRPRERNYEGNARPLLLTSRLYSGLGDQVSGRPCRG